MKYILFILLMLPLGAFSQTEQDYKDVMDKFVRWYNADRNDSICTLFREERSGGCFWNSGDPAERKAKYGKITSHTYMGKVTRDPNDIRAFKIVFEKAGTKAMSFHIGKQTKKFGTFRFVTTDDEIEEMLKRTK